ncbi:MAG TPA: tetratricopeptide repeat protein [Lacunisphaera sp.]|nr:tetratricopeptide repeat protein [Lacunisphaera sp.]
MAAAVAAGAWGVRNVAARRQWQRIRPGAPDAAALTAPGLASRVNAAADRLRAWPPNRAALAEFSRLCHANGLLPAAIAGYRALMVLEPAEPRWPHLLASILAGYGRLDEALPLLRRTTTLAPDYVPAWLRLGDALLKSNAVEEAARAYESALRLAPSNPDALLGLARCDLQKERWTSARQRLQQIVSEAPDSADALSLLATVQERLGNAAAADAARSRQSTQGVYGTAPDPWLDEITGWCLDPYLLLVAGSAAISEGAPAKALPLLARAQTLAPQDPRIHRQAAKALSKLGDANRARAELERAVALAPTDDMFRLDLIAFLQAGRDPAAVAAAVQDGVAACPGSAALQYAAGRIARDAGRLEEAAEHFRRAWQAQPDEPAAARDLARTYFRLNRDDDGIAILEQVLAAQPRDGATHVLLVQHGIEAGDRRTEAWLRQAQGAGVAADSLNDLEQAYRRRFSPSLR